MIQMLGVIHHLQMHSTWMDETVRDTHKGRAFVVVPLLGKSQRFCLSAPKEQVYSFRSVVFTLERWFVFI